MADPKTPTQSLTPALAQTQAFVNFPVEDLPKIGIKALAATTPILGPGTYVVDGATGPRVVAVEDGEGNIHIHGLQFAVAPGTFVVPRQGVVLTAKDMHKQILRVMARAMK